MDEDKVELKSDQAAYVYKKEEESIPLCVECNHPFHFSRCFATIDVGRAFTQCRCKKGVRADDN